MCFYMNSDWRKIWKFIKSYILSNVINIIIINQWIITHTMSKKYANNIQSIKETFHKNSENVNFEKKNFLTFIYIFPFLTIEYNIKVWFIFLILYIYANTLFTKYSVVCNLFWYQYKNDYHLYFYNYTYIRIF